MNTPTETAAAFEQAERLFWEAKQNLDRNRLSFAAKRQYYQAVRRRDAARRALETATHADHLQTVDA